jgi:hypothetical protein
MADVVNGRECEATYRDSPQLDSPSRPGALRGVSRLRRRDRYSGRERASYRSDGNRLTMNDVAADPSFDNTVANRSPPLNQFARTARSAAAAPPARTAATIAACSAYVALKSGPMSGAYSHS